MSPVDDFAQAYVRAIEAREQMNAREAAEAAWYPGHPLGTVEAIEAKIRARRSADAALIAQAGTQAA
jgi:hypothetical protein